MQGVLNPSVEPIHRTALAEFMWGDIREAAAYAERGTGHSEGAPKQALSILPDIPGGGGPVNGLGMKADSGPQYDVTPDGQRFVMMSESERVAAATQVNVVLNWFEELKQKVPVGK